MTNPLAQDLGGVVRLLESVEVPDYVPEHSRLSCSDEDPCNAEGGTHGCERCTWIELERGQAAAAFLRTHSAEIAGALRDAERLDWLIGNCAVLETNGYGDWRVKYHWTSPITYGPYADAPRSAIDTAMQQGGRGGDHA